MSDIEREPVWTRWYRERVGEPRTGDEVSGYWVFVLGVVLGIAGIGLTATSQPITVMREAGIAVAAFGLVLILVGPIVRMPIRDRAQQLAYLGALICIAAIVWFLYAYPFDWMAETGNATVVALYALGALVIAFGGIFVPIFSTGPTREEYDELRHRYAESETERSALAEEVADLRETLADTEADESDVARLVGTLRDQIAEAADREADMARSVEGLRLALVDTEADEADLAALLASMRRSQARFELYEDRGGNWRWRLRHRNGNVIAASGEGYTRRHNAQKGLSSVRRNALGATVLDLREEAALAEAGEAFEPATEAESQATFEVYEDSAGEYRWRLVHRNGNLIADGSEGYASRRNARDAVERVREYVGPADYLRADPTAFEVYADRAGQWRWRLVHRNGNVLADGGEGYASRSNARRAVDRIRESVGGMDFEVYEDDAGDYRWRLRSGNDVVADSGQGYSARSGAEDAADRVREYAPEADALDIGMAAVEIYEDRGGQWRWRLRHRNGNVLADSGEGYASRSDARDAIEGVKRHAPNAAAGE